MDIQDKVVVITGGGRGIGRAIAIRLASKGADIALLDLDRDAMAETMQLCSNATVRTYQCNVTDEPVVVEVFRQVAEDFGNIHGLINNAGILRDGLLVKVKDGRVVNKMSADDFSLVVDVHMKGAFLCGREAASVMIEKNVDEGCIINMSSGAFRGNFGQTNYAAAKAGLVAMTRVWAAELARYNIRTAAIAPGVIETDMVMSMPVHARERLTSSTPLQRLGSPDNVAQTVQQVFENDFMSGGVIDVSGGWYV